MRIIAEIGDIICCDNGHPIAKFRQTVMSQDVISVENFDWCFDTKKPLEYTTAKPCQKCGAPYIRNFLPVKLKRE